MDKFIMCALWAFGTYVFGILEAFFLIIFYYNKIT